MDQGLKNLYRSGSTTCAVISNNRSTGIFDYMQSHNAVKIKKKRKEISSVLFFSFHFRTLVLHFLVIKGV